MDHGYVCDADPTRIDLDAVWAFLSTDAYWGRWRTRADVEAQVAGAWRVVGAYSANGMVGFARAVSDGVAFAYLADVFVLPDDRGRGLGRRLVAAMIDDGPGAAFRWVLHTADMHGLYAGFGFAAPDATLLERPAAPHQAPGPPARAGHGEHRLTARGPAAGGDVTTVELGTQVREEGSP